MKTSIIFHAKIGTGNRVSIPEAIMTAEELHQKDIVVLNITKVVPNKKEGF